MNTLVLVSLLRINETFLLVRLLLGSNCSRIVLMPSYRMFACMSSLLEHTRSDPLAPIINSVKPRALHVSLFVFLRATRRMILLKRSLPVSRHLNEYMHSMRAFCQSISLMGCP